ncbi:unnamed protein product, partial [Phaeothamnion confervicola]
ETESNKRDRLEVEMVVAGSMQTARAPRTKKTPGVKPPRKTAASRRKAAAARHDDVLHLDGPVSWKDIKVVQGLIERCLQKYKSQEEIVATLEEQANVDPHFTMSVWAKLEEQNPEFFYAYNVQLQLLDQIMAYNFLVDEQVCFLQHMQAAVAQRAEVSCFRTGH